MSKRKTTGGVGRKKAATGSTAISPAYQEILKHVYHPNRLKVLQPIKTVKGTVVLVKPEPDGDYHVYLQDGTELEIICATKITQQDAIGPCKGYLNKVRIPKVGEKIAATGQYVYDLHHNQYEIHPVFILK